VVDCGPGYAVVRAEPTTTRREGGKVGADALEHALIRTKRSLYV
jgi:hypothetical protein